MVELRVVSGQSRGRSVLVTSFPFLIGRSSQAGLSLSDPGIWDRHAQVTQAADGRLVLRIEPGATASVGGKSVSEHALRNGDLIDCGGARLAFWIAAAPQRSHGWRELAVWAGLAGTLLLELGLIFALQINPLIIIKKRAINANGTKM